MSRRFLAPLVAVVAVGAIAAANVLYVATQRGSAPVAALPIAGSATADGCSAPCGAPCALAVDPNKCVGCGVCTRIAPKVFTIDPSTGKAKVTDPNGAPPQVIQKAIDHCRPGAIIRKPQGK